MFKILIHSCLAILGVGMLAAQHGCVPVLIGAVAYDSAQTKKERAAFHEQNIEREKAGLKPLTWEEWRQTKQKSTDPTKDNAGTTK